MYTVIKPLTYSPQVEFVQCALTVKTFYLLTKQRGWVRGEKISNNLLIILEENIYRFVKF